MKFLIIHGNPEEIWTHWVEKEENPTPGGADRKSPAVKKSSRDIKRRIPPIIRRPEPPSPPPRRLRKELLYHRGG